MGWGEEMRTYLGSVGCKLNQAEMDALAEALARAGHEIVGSAAEAELCVLNTCAVTAVAAQKSRQALRRLQRENPGARLVATGCYAELAPAEVRELPGVVLVAGNREKEELARLLAGPAQAAAGPAVRRHTRALVKVQDGCDNACAYCIIHTARGPQRSRPAEEVVAEVRARREAGYQEVVLTGVHIGAYGRDREGRRGIDLWELVARILAETEVPRLRLSSIEPWDLPAEALGLWADARLCAHLHLPLQSGCDATLRRMGRRYTTAEFERLARAARAASADLALTTDVIVGFPGETEEEFAESLAFVRSVGPARAHVFPFSARPGTPAAGMAGQVPPAVKEERAAAMRRAAAECREAFEARFVGRRMEVLWEAARQRAGGRVWSGLTGNYLRVYAASEEELHNLIREARLVAPAAGGLLGEL